MVTSKLVFGRDVQCCIQSYLASTTSGVVSKGRRPRDYEPEWYCASIHAIVV